MAEVKKIKKRSAAAQRIIGERPKAPTEKIIVLRDIKAKVKSLGEEAKIVQTEVIDMIKGKGNKTMTVQDSSGVDIMATVVESTSMAIDEARLKKAVGAATWKKITTPRLDDKLLEQAIQAGEVDVNVVAQCTTESPRAPYIKLTEKGGGR